MLMDVVADLVGPHNERQLYACHSGNVLSISRLTTCCSATQIRSFLFNACFEIPLTHAEICVLMPFSVVQIWP
jgi:hypothetical protein